MAFNSRRVNTQTAEWPSPATRTAELMMQEPSTIDGCLQFLDLYTPRTSIVSHSSQLQRYYGYVCAGRVPVQILQLGTILARVPATRLLFIGLKEEEEEEITAECCTFPPVFVCVLLL